MSALRASVVLPVYRQADHIVGVVQGYAAALQGLKAPVELLLVSNGEPVARILPVVPKRKVESLAWLRARMKPVSIDTATLLREERDRR